MADTNAQMEELARILEQVNYELNQYGRITKQTADDRFDAEVQAATGIRNATKGLDKMGEGLSAVADAGVAAGKAMYEGKKGAAAFNDSIDSMAKAAQAAGIALSLMIPGGPLIKLFVAGMTAAVTATAAYVKAANEMADKLYKGYNGMAKAGAAAADGMTGMYKGAKKLGLSMNELDGYVSLVAASSKDLAMFSGTVFEGRKQFEDVGASLEDFRTSAFAAGMTQQDLNEGTMGYIKLQSRLGYARKMSTDELAQGAKKYLIEQDALTKLTGMSRKEMEDQREAALMEEQFAAKIRELQLQGNHAAAKELQDLNLLYSQAGKEMGQGFRALATGNLANDQAQKLNLASQGEVMRQNQLIESGMATAAQAFGPAAKVIGKTSDEIGATLGQFGAYNETFGNFSEQQKLRILAEKDYNKQLELIKEEQAKQGLTTGKAVDGITDQYAKNTKQQQELNKQMEDAVFKGIGNALTVTKKLGDVTEHLAVVFDKLATAANKLLKVVGLGVDDPAVAAAKEKEESAKKQREEAQASAKKATTETEKQAASTALAAAEERLNQAQREKTQAIRVEGGMPAAPTTPAMNETAGGAAVGVRMRGGLKSQTAPAAPTTPPLGNQSGAETRRLGIPPGKGVPAEATSGSVKLEDYIKFGGNTGSQAHFDQLNPTVRESFVEMARQYFDTTGNKLQVNSAFRSAEEQGKVNSGPNPKAAPGMSLHQVGRAVDINSDQRATLEKLGLLNQYGFKPLQGDPPHIYMAKGGIVGARAGGTEIIAGEAGQDEAVIPLEGGAVPVKLNMKPPESDFEASITASLKVLADRLSNTSETDVLKSTISNFKTGNFGLPDASEVTQTFSKEARQLLDAGAEKYEKLLSGISLKDALGGPTFAGMNEYAGYNQGPMSTDLSAVKTIAEAVGAFDKMSQTITDPKIWKDILSSGLATNYQLGAATLGTQGIPGLGEDIASRLKEIKEQPNTDSESALKMVTDEFKAAMAALAPQLAQLTLEQNQDSMGGVASLLQELVAATKNGVDVQEKILAANY
jgi:hypothetical protein